MTEIHVQSPGLFTTVQDLGREGFGPIGVSPSGAADPTSLRIGNRLVGNPDGAAALEMTLLGGTFLFPQGAIIALAGSDFGATLDDSAIPPHQTIEIHPGQTLRLGPTRSGARCYLCVHGGISVELFLGSASTHVLSGLGGFDGRPLRKGDVLVVGPAPQPFHTRALASHATDLLAQRKTFRITPGPQVEKFSEPSRQLFYESTFSIAEESDRLGLRLTGPAIHANSHREMITEGVSLGAIQITPEGQPIILFVDQQTTGGYPKIANVITADLPSLGQLRPRDQVRFEPVNWDAARQLLIEQKRLLNSADLIIG
ncbi:MAG TPA: biotin-dependent carboxyltransferase family protein [Terriglobales bacterium]